ncbi:hypothetical protein HF078_07110 [Bacillus sp. RO2]|uniref:hypothetical protein n=1 Tax=Bacillus sp. RO2 TaxID=2723913 RepID=UPI00145E3444|nr:hypothetical protein [Bacillus sp. RO2]NMH72834.1 hypothetical protein [Bacillus sp. RO2]
MEFFIYGIALVSFFLLLLFFFLVPLKLTKTGKWLLPGISLLVSLIGLYIIDMFTLWHSIILMVFLLLLAAILLQRLPLFINTTPYDENNSTNQGTDNK